MRVRHPVVRGHPLHAMVSDLPAAFILAALAATIAERARPSPQRRHTSTACTALALGSAVVAGSIGWWDWVTIPNEHPAKAPATRHGLINTAGVGVGAIALLLPRRRLELLVGLSAAVLVAAWIGGDLVYRIGWRVRPAEELELIDQGTPRDEARAIVDKHERDDLLFP